MLFQGLTHKYNKDFSILITGMHISHTFKKKTAGCVGSRSLDFLKWYLRSHMKSPSLNFGCHFDNQLYLILSAA